MKRHTLHVIETEDGMLTLMVAPRADGAQLLVNGHHISEAKNVAMAIDADGAHVSFTLPPPESVFAEEPAKGWECSARKSNAGANDPAECDWPVCGCDPHAIKVIEALSEAGRLKE